MRPKIKNSVKKLFNLDEKEVELMKRAKHMEGFDSDSAYIGWLIRTHNSLSDPNKHLQELANEEELFNRKLENIRKQRNEILSTIELSNQIKEEKFKERPKAIEIISKKIIEEGIFEAERIATNWGMMLGVNHFELLSEAITNLKKEQMVMNK